MYFSQEYRTLVEVSYQIVIHEKYPEITDQYLPWVSEEETDRLKVGICSLICEIDSVFSFLQGKGSIIVTTIAVAMYVARPSLKRDSYILWQNISKCYGLTESEWAYTVHLYKSMLRRRGST